MHTLVGFGWGAQVIAAHACTQRGERYSSLWPWEQGFLFYPILYLYRHHFELTIKRLTKNCRELMDKDEPHSLRRWIANVFNRRVGPILLGCGVDSKRLNKLANNILGLQHKPYGHDLKRLWHKGLRPLLVDLQMAHYPWIGELAAVDSYIDQIWKIDKNSESSRYPTNQNGVVSLSKLGLVSLRQVRDSMERLSGYFEWLDGTIDLLLDHHGEMMAHEIGS
jgi:hypothetical protein